MSAEEDRVLLQVFGAGAHEVGNAVGVAVGALGLLEGAVAGLPAEEREEAALALSLARTALGDAAALLDGMRMGAADLGREAVGERDLRQILDQTAALLRPQARRAGATIEVEGLPLVWTGAAAPLRRTLVNLVRNALEHGRAKRIRLRVGAGETGPELRVEDDGVGVDPALIDHLFEEGASSAAGPGRGFGLARCRADAQALGGSIRLEGGQGGCAFVVALPG